MRWVHEDVLEAAVRKILRYVGKSDPAAAERLKK